MPALACPSIPCSESHASIGQLPDTVTELVNDRACICEHADMTTFTPACILYMPVQVPHGVQHRSALTSSRNTRDSQPPALCASSVTGEPSAERSSTVCSAAVMRSMYLWCHGWDMSAACLNIVLPIACACAPFRAACIESDSVEP